MDTKGTETATAVPEDARPITFHGREILTLMPNEAQIAVIARLTFLSPDDAKDVEKVRTSVNRVAKLIAGLFVHKEDWDFVEDAMAAREVDWRDVLGIFELLADAHGLRNRAARRSSKTPRARRG